MFQEVDFNTYQLALGEIATRTTGEFIYEEVDIPRLTSLTYFDARINAGNKDNIGIYGVTDRHVVRQGTGTYDVDPNIVYIDDVAQTIEFDTTALGKAYNIQIPVSTTDISCIGGNSSNGEFYDLSFEGAFFTTANDGPYTIIVPHLRRLTTPSLSVGVGLSTNYTVSFQAVCGDDDEYERKPFRIYAPHCFPRDIAKVLREDGDVVLREEDTFVLREDQRAGCEDIEDVDVTLGNCLLHEDDFSVLYEDGCRVCFEEAECLLYEDLCNVLYEDGGKVCFQQGSDLAGFAIAQENDDDILQENDDVIEQEVAP